MRDLVITFVFCAVLSLPALIHANANATTTEATNTTTTTADQNATTAAQVTSDPNATTTVETSTSASTANTTESATSNTTSAASNETTTAAPASNATTAAAASSNSTTAAAGATTAAAGATTAAAGATTAAAGATTAAAGGTTAAAGATTAAAGATTAAAGATTAAAGATTAAAAATTQGTTTTTKAPEQVVEVSASLSLTATFTSDLADSTSEAYQNLSADATATLTAALQGESGFRGVTITGFSNGSIVVRYTVQFDMPASGTPDTTAIASSVSTAVTNSANSGNSIGGFTVDVSTITATAQVVTLPRVCRMCSSTDGTACTPTDKTCASSTSTCWAIYDKATTTMTVGCSEDMTSLYGSKTCAQADPNTCEFTGSDSSKCKVMTCCTSNQCDHNLDKLLETASSATRVSFVVLSMLIPLVMALLF